MIIPIGDHSVAIHNDGVLATNIHFVVAIVVLIRSPLVNDLLWIFNTAGTIWFDSLAEDSEHKSEVSIGVRHNEFIDILSDEITTPSLYGWVEPSQLRVSKKLQNKLANGPGSNYFLMDGGKRVEAFKYASGLVRVRQD